MAGDPFRQSTNDYDWLGSGVYFWEYAPVRALEWSRRRYGDEGAVIEATVTLGECLNLLDSEHFAGLQAAYEDTVTTLHADGLPVPVNKGLRHMLDRAVVDALCIERARRTTEAFDTVRGCFPEGEPVYDGSRILRYTHVQIAVRNADCISGLKLVHFDGTRNRSR
jgi:hypothetical protein